LFGLIEVTTQWRPGRVVTRVSCYKPHNLFKKFGCPLESTQAIPTPKSYMLVKKLWFSIR